MMKMKKLVLILMTMVMLASTFLVSGCGDDDGVQEIQWAFWDNLDVEDKIAQGYGKVIERFNNDFKGKYHCTPVTCTMAEYDQKLNTMIAANKCPDLFICNPGSDLTEYVDNGVAADLTDIIKNEEKEWGDSFTPGIFDRVSYDGNIMAIPVNFAAAAVFYNQALFKKANVRIPRTYGELINVCEKLKRAHITPIAVSAARDSEWCLGMLAGYLCEREGGPTNLDNVKQGTGSWLDITFVRAAKRLVQLSKYFQYTAKTDQNQVATDRFVNGKAAMLLQGSWVIAQMNKPCGVFTFPATMGAKANQTRIMVKTDNMVMSSKTKNREACIALLKYFTDDTAQRYTAEHGGKFPVTKCNINISRTPLQFRLVKKIIDSKPQYTGFYDESIENNEAGDLFNKTMVNIYKGNYTIKQGLTTLENYYKKNIWN